MVFSLFVNIYYYSDIIEQILSQIETLDRWYFSHCTWYLEQLDSFFDGFQ
jgi:hypothetical protein